MFDLCEHLSSWNVVYQESSHAQTAACHCAFWTSRETLECFASTSKAPCLRHAAAAILHLRCQAPGKWVMGSVRRWCARWGCEVPLLGRFEPEAPSLPPKLFLRLPRHRSSSRTKWARVGRTPDTSPVAFDGTFITCQMISTRWPDLIVSLSTGLPVRAQDVYPKLSQTWAEPFWQHTQDQHRGRYSPYATAVATVCFVRHSRCPVPCVCSCTFGTLFRYLWQYTASKSWSVNGDGTRIHHAGYNQPIRLTVISRSLPQWCAHL